MLVLTALAISFLGQASQVASQSSSPNHVFIEGQGTLTIRGRASTVRTVLYGHDERMTIFQVPTTTGAVGFVGSSDLQPSMDQYILRLDYVYSRQAGLPDSQRLGAQGTCEANVSNDGEIVHSLSCRAQTDLGEFTLTFSGRRIEGPR